MNYVPEFDELYSISDLHIGGARGFQIFDQGELLGQFIDHLRDRPANKDVALVINGDAVDFLAEPKPRYFDPEGAIDKLDRIVKDAAFAPVFEALNRFVGKARRHLAITLGNHDLELALPWVREHLLDTISDKDDAAKGRITLAFDGAGFACAVKDKSVLCVHGNDVDQWNWTEYENLRRCGVDYTQGQRSKEWMEWTPNAGTKVVIDVMNDIKQDCPFVDLLKPENQGVVPILAILKPEYKSRLDAVWGIAGKRFIWDPVRRTVQNWFLSAEEEEQAADEDPAQSLNQFLGSRVSRSLSGRAQELEEGDILDDLEEELDSDPMSLVGTEEKEQQLGVVDAIAKALKGADKYEVVQEALDGLKKDQTFDLDDKDSTFKEIGAAVGADFDIVMTGHTHLERVLARSGGRGAYFNSGTWVPLIRLTPDVVEADQAFRDAVKILVDTSSRKELGKAKITVNGEKRPLVMRKPAVIAVREEKGQVTGSLQRVSLVGDEVKLDPVKPKSAA